LVARNTGNCISGHQISKIFWGSIPPDDPPIHAYSATHVAFRHCYTPNILSHRKVLFQEMPPHGKILKKGPGMCSHWLFQLLLWQLRNKLLSPCYKVDDGNTRLMTCYKTCYRLVNNWEQAVRTRLVDKLWDFYAGTLQYNLHVI
jgi:hypothetical protein